MAGRSAILFLLDDRYRTGSETPLMLHRVMGVPLLKWLTEALSRAGVTRMFLACAPALLEAAKPCIPAAVTLTVASDENPSDLLHVFLSTAEDSEESVLVITGPVLYLPFRHAAGSGRTANACMVSRQDLMAALDETAPIGHFLKRASDPCTEDDGFYTVYSPEELPDWQPVLTGDYLRQLIRSGVEIWDLQNTYVEPGVPVGIGTVLLPGTVLQGDTVVGYGSVIGPNTRLVDTKVGNHTTVEQTRAQGARIGSNVQVGPFAHLRPGTVLEARTKAGAFVELKNTSLGAGTQVAHLSYLGDATVGEAVNVGCGTVTANFDRVEKHPTVIEKEAFIGCNTTFVAPVTVGQGAYVGAGSVVTEDIPTQALAIGRAKQLNKKEWALWNKTAEE